MKLSYLVLLFAVAATCIAQETVKPPDPTHNTATNSQGVIVPEQEWPDLRNLSKQQLEQKLQEMSDRENQAGCPVLLTSAQIAPYLMLLRNSTGFADASQPRDPNLDLNFRNASGKAIRSIQFDAEFLTKKSIYDLQAAKIDLHLTTNGTTSLDKTLDHLRHLPLAQRPHPIALDKLTLEQVTFADGSIWSPAKDNHCGYSPNREWEIGAR